MRRFSELMGRKKKKPTNVILKKRKKERRNRARQTFLVSKINTPKQAAVKGSLPRYHPL